MALALDASSPARLNMTKGAGTGSAIAGTTASFDPPAGILVVTTVCDSNTGITPTVTISNNGTALTWTRAVARGASDGGTSGFCCIDWAVLTAGRTGMTITSSASGHNIATAGDRGSLKVYLFTGQHATTPNGAVGENSSTTNNYTPSLITTGSANSIIVACGSEWNALGAPTSSDLTEDAFNIASTLSGLHGYKAVTTATSYTVNFDASGTGTADWNVCAFEVIEAAGGGGGSAFLVPNRRARNRNLYRM